MFNREIEKEMSLRIGRNLRAIREFKGLSQTSLAEMLGVSFQQVQKYETGKNRLSIEKIVYLSEQLDIAVQAFIDGLEYQKKPLPELPLPQRRLYQRFIGFLPEMLDAEMEMFKCLLDIVARRQEKSAARLAK